MYNTFIGIDPGLKGGIAIISRNDLITQLAENLPILDKKLDVSQLVTILIDALDINRIGKRTYRSICCIEKVMAFNGQGSISTTTFLLLAGELSGCIQTLGIPVMFISPLTWHPAILGKQIFPKGTLPKERRKTWKRLSMEYATKKHPDLDINNDGKSDAICLAEYALWKTTQSVNRDFLP